MSVQCDAVDHERVVKEIDVLAEVAKAVSSAEPSCGAQCTIASNHKSEAHARTPREVGDQLRPLQRTHEGTVARL